MIYIEKPKYIGDYGYEEGKQLFVIFNTKKKQIVRVSHSSKIIFTTSVTADKNLATAIKLSISNKNWFKKLSKTKSRKESVKKINKRFKMLKHCKVIELNELKVVGV